MVSRVLQHGTDNGARGGGQAPVELLDGCFVTQRRPPEPGHPVDHARSGQRVLPSVVKLAQLLPVVGHNAHRGAIEQGQYQRTIGGINRLDVRAVFSHAQTNSCAVDRQGAPAGDPLQQGINQRDNAQRLQLLAQGSSGINAQHQIPGSQMAQAKQRQLLLEPPVGKVPKAGPAQQQQRHLPVQRLQFALGQTQRCAATCCACC